MSGIFGAFNRNGIPVEKKVVDTMLDAMSYWEPDDRGIWTDGPVALGHAMLWNTPESKYEHLPLQRDGYVLTMDARIDNREELAKELDLPNRPMEKIGDSEFILAAYLKWGEECPKYLLGDFAFAIWDEKKQQLFCTRDYIGVKPFYYFINDGKFIYSNDIGVLLSHVDIANVLNDKAMAYYLKHGLLSDIDMTFYKNIRKLHPATSLTVMADDEKYSTYWKAEECPKILCKTLDDYTHKARELLEQAVNVRIRSVYPIASHLSGGIDSSSIAVLASRKLGESSRMLTGYNWIPVLDEDSGTDYFEWGNSKKIASLENIEHQAVDLSENDILNLFKTIDITHGDTITFWYEHQIQKDASEKNIRVILSGTGGDEFISHNAYGYIAGFFWRGEFQRAYKALQREGLRSRHPFLGFFRRFYAHVILPSIPGWLYCIYNGTYCSFNNISKYIFPSMSESIRRVRGNDKLLMDIGIQNKMLNALHDGLIQARVESWATSGRSYRMEYRYPLLDKRLVEFALGIPEEVFRHNSKGRYLFRQSIEGLLPQEIIWSNTKYEPKRVKKYIALSQNAQSVWRQFYNSDKNETEFVKLDTLYQEIEKYSLKKNISEEDYDKITVITNLILAVETYNKENKK